MIKLKPEIHAEAVVKLSLESSKATSVPGGLLFKFKGDLGIILYNYGAKVVWYEESRRLWWFLGDVLDRAPEDTWDDSACPHRTRATEGPKIAEWIDLAVQQIKAKI